MADKSFWNGKKVLITGHTGFKGSWLAIWLVLKGAIVVGYSLAPKTEKDNYTLSGISNKIIDIRGDIRDRDSLYLAFEENKPEIVFHLAAQPLVIKSYENPVETYETNVIGTLNVLEAIRRTDSVREGIFITTDKCYKNSETLEGYKESDQLGGYDIYSSSKACDEILISSYRDSFFNSTDYEKHKKAIASVRAGNVIGGGDWAEKRIVPDCIRAIEKGVPIEIRNRSSIRPWQHVLEPLNGYIMLAEKMYSDPINFSGAYNFGPDESGLFSVWDIASLLIQKYEKGVLMDSPSKEEFHEAQRLVLNIEKAKEKLRWAPKLNVNDAVEWTVDWYKKYLSECVMDICIGQIEKYEGL